MGLLRAGILATTPLSILVLVSCSSTPADATPTCSRADDPREGELVQQASIFVDGSVARVRSCFVEFTPAYPLWTDGKVARRWIYVPEGRKVEAPSPDHFDFPVGTRALKQYSTPDGKPIELRVVERTTDGFRMGSYVYAADGKDAYYTELGGRDTLGLTPPHEVPSAAQCNRCHGGEPSHLLAFTAVQLGRGGSPSLAEFVSNGLVAVSEVSRYALPPGDEVAWRAMGALHSNCGHCHADTGSEADLGLSLRLEAEARPLTETAIYRTTVHQRLAAFSTPGIDERIVPGDPDKSGVFVRLATRGTTTAMPPLGSLVRNPTLEDDVSRWIREMRP